VLRAKGPVKVRGL